MMPKYIAPTYTAEQMRDCRRRVSAREERIAELESQLARVTAQRDQCREALRDYMGNNGSGPKSCGHMAHCVCPYDKARAALRACESEGGAE